MYTYDNKTHIITPFYYITLHYKIQLNFTSLTFNFLTLFLKICGLQGKVISASAGRLFQSFMVLFTKEYFPISVLCHISHACYMSLQTHPNSVIRKLSNECKLRFCHGRALEGPPAVHVAPLQLDYKPCGVERDKRLSSLQSSPPGIQRM
jgi:hypothetical protein